MLFKFIITILAFAWSVASLRPPIDESTLTPYQHTQLTLFRAIMSELVTTANFGMTDEAFMAMAAKKMGEAYPDLNGTSSLLTNLLLAMSSLRN